jgi:hypothetical protein
MLQYKYNINNIKYGFVEADYTATEGKNVQ